MMECNNPESCGETRGLWSESKRKKNMKGGERKGMVCAVEGISGTLPSPLTLVVGSHTRVFHQQPTVM
jgi:hypothetical protein